MHRASILGVVAMGLVTTSARADEPPLVNLPPPPPPSSVPTELPGPPAIDERPREPTTPPAKHSASSASQLQSQSSTKLTYESTHTSVDRPAEPPGPKHWTQDDSRILHGFRLGYAHVMNYDTPSENLGGVSIKDKLNLKSPNHFLIGYELVYRVVSHSWLNVVLIGNGMIAGMEQSKFLPTANLLIGAELANSFQIGVGGHLSPLKGNEAHTIIAAGWTPRVGSLYTPLHVFFVPDVEGFHRMGATVGVTF